ncbi:MAG: hypothetical protein AAFY26_21075 [Cyanobacteria bacterium J06638_22]
MKRVLSFAFGFVMLLGAGAVAQTRDLRSELQSEVCRQNWESAIVLTDRLLATDLGLQREAFLDLRETLVGYRDSGTFLEFVEGCGNGAGLDWEGGRSAAQTRSGDADRPADYFSTGGSSSFSGGSGSTGNCVNPWDTDSLGRRCGGRASSVRPGGN